MVHIVVRIHICHTNVDTHMYMHHDMHTMVHIVVHIVVHIGWICTTICATVLGVLVYNSNVDDQILICSLRIIVILCDKCVETQSGQLYFQVYQHPQPQGSTDFLQHNSTTHLI